MSAKLYRPAVWVSRDGRPCISAQLYQTDEEAQRDLAGVRVVGLLDTPISIRDELVRADPRYLEELQRRKVLSEPLTSPTKGTPAHARAQKARR